MKVHFIAIGGSAMHNLAIALHLKGEQVSGSDDEIFEPSRSRLEKYGLLPSKIGWNDNFITSDLDAVILGMHARADNPELLRAQELGLKIFSYPEYLYEQTKEKVRVVIGGSHGKTSITSMILHVLTDNGLEHDYMVGAQLEGFECMVKLSENAKIAVLEGDEYLSSPIDRRPKFHLYRPNIAVISGIAWDHINVFPTFDNYVLQFADFVRLITPNGKLIYNSSDDNVCQVAKENLLITCIPYQAHRNIVRNGTTFLVNGKEEEFPLEIFGGHNLENLMAAFEVCKALGLGEEQFYKSIGSFKGASKRLELVSKTSDFAMFKDFAHSPSKLKATTSAVKYQYPGRKLVACMELHTFSSLNREFLSHYHGTMAAADVAMVYYSPKTLIHKKLEEITPELVKEAFGSKNVVIYTDSSLMLTELRKMNWHNSNLLMMSSGNFDGVDFLAFSQSLNKELIAE